jgi:5'-nucleotidase
MIKKEEKLNILITNDDGITAPGIKYLVEAITPFALVTVVAPATEQSAKSLSLTRTPLRVTPVDIFNTPSWSVDGTPVDCIKVALSVLHLQPDLIISGINKGSNAGRNVLYSGTVGGAIEGSLRGIPGIAFSCSDIEDPEYERLCAYVWNIIQFVVGNPLPFGTILNVNFPTTMRDYPTKSTRHIQGVKLTRQGKTYWIEHYPSNAQQLMSQKGSEHIVEFGVTIAPKDEEEDSDIYWLEKGYITAVPIHIDELTDWRYFRRYKSSFEQSTICPIPRKE